MPAPVSSRRSACSMTMICKPARARLSAAVRPPIPAPAMTAVRVAVTGAASGCGRRVSQGAFRWDCGVRVERAVVLIECRAIGADDLRLVAHIEKHVRMVERRLGADAHEFARSDLD